MANEILQYTSKDFTSIKNDLIAAIPALSDTWTSRDDGDPGIVLVNLMAALGDMISYNNDKQSLEYYASTVTQRKNAVKLFELIGYQMHWFKSAITQVTIKNSPNSVMMSMFNDIYVAVNIYGAFDTQGNVTIEVNNAVNAYDNRFKRQNGSEDEFYFQYNTQQVTWSSVNELLTDKWDQCVAIFNSFKQDNVLELNTYINSPQSNLTLSGNAANGVLYTIVPTTYKEVENVESSNFTKIEAFSDATFSAVQGYLCSTTFNRTQMKNNRYYIPDMFLDEDHMYLAYCGTSSTENLTFIEKVPNLLTHVAQLVDQEDKEPEVYFQFRTDEYDRPYIELSSYWETSIGKDASLFKFFYIKTVGSQGNITTDYLTRISNTPSSGIIITNKDCTNYLMDDDGNIICSPGKDIQTAHEAYMDSINYIMTYDTIVTIYDFARLARRQGEVSNAIAVDCQYANDLNNDIRSVCYSYTLEQLRTILGNYNQSETKDDLAARLYNIRKVNYDYMDNAIYGNESDDETPYKPYGINIYPICWNLENIHDGYQYSSDTITTDSEVYAYYGNIIHSKTIYENTKEFPYKMYRIVVENDTTSVPSEAIPKITNKIEVQLDTEYDKRRIVNVKPEYTAIRVFEWRACGTIHLTKSVSLTESKNIIKNVIENLKNTFSIKNIEIGTKISYMDVINAIMDSDSRIKYFDAGIGDTKLISFADHFVSNSCNIEAYFNPESIMYYVQTVEENENSDGDYYNMLVVDPTYIRE